MENYYTSRGLYWQSSEVFTFFVSVCAAVAGVVLIGDYFLAEYLNKRKRQKEKETEELNVGSR